MTGRKTRACFEFGRSIELHIDFGTLFNGFLRRQLRYIWCIKRKTKSWCQPNYPTKVPQSTSCFLHHHAQGKPVHKPNPGGWRQVILENFLAKITSKKKRQFLFWKKIGCSLSCQKKENSGVNCNKGSNLWWFNTHSIHIWYIYIPTFTVFYHQKRPNP